MPTNHADTAVVGGGIIGLAHALAAARRGDRVVLFERSGYSVGASIRSFGLVWPVGQPNGHLRQRALCTREIWLEIARKTGMWCRESGSLHLARHKDEEAVLEEFLCINTAAADEGTRLVTSEEAAKFSSAVRTDGLLSALWSPVELNIDPRQAIPALEAHLVDHYGVDIQFGTTVRGVSLPHVETSKGIWHADRVFVCSGDDFETLYPQAFAASNITRCKLQMMRTAVQPDAWQLGAALCAGLTLLHSAAFRSCISLHELRGRMEDAWPFQRDNGIHVLLSQTASGALIIGGSHHYAHTHAPFADENVNAAIMKYLHTFAHAPHLAIAQRWVGYYSSLNEGGTELVVQPEPGVIIVNGLGDAGMTLSFGLAEEVLG
ncbi:TIGR03364 family FAD-dependent oxidoreductase [Streptomyces sp. NPDC015139]|uniref:TIGR03364 family FAD-dependent oxidoreductase n=1 Tax=Streptomyces sp. NPDC015139 TaxID=3364942 RepID=UPI0036FA59AF